MSPNEKANQLVWDAMDVLSKNPTVKEVFYDDGKRIAIFMVDELIRVMPSVNGRPPNYKEVNELCSEYWVEVKKEIEML